MLIATEFKENTQVREYLEKSYRLLFEHMSGKWRYNEPEKQEDELNKRELLQTGRAGIRDAAADMKLDPETGEPGSMHIDAHELAAREARA